MSTKNRYILNYAGAFYTGARAWSMLRDLWKAYISDPMPTGSKAKIMPAMANAITLRIGKKAKVSIWREPRSVRSNQSRYMQELITKGLTPGPLRHRRTAAPTPALTRHRVGAAPRPVPGAEPAPIRPQTAGELRERLRALARQQAAPIDTVPIDVEAVERRIRQTAANLRAEAMDVEVAHDPAERVVFRTTVGARFPDLGRWQPYTQQAVAGAEQPQAHVQAQPTEVPRNEWFDVNAMRWVVE